MKQITINCFKVVFVTLLFMLSVTFFVADTAYATNGYFSHGYSIESMALGGAGVALPQNSLDASTNPASMAFIGNRFDLGLTLFNPNREYTIKGAPTGLPGTFGLTPGTVKSGTEWFLIPSLGINWKLDDASSLGLSVYGNGGMNTDYSKSTFYGSDPTGVDLMQLFIAPTYARKFSSKFAVGITPILAYQRFEAKGLQAFGVFSSDSSNLTNNGHDSSFGYGVRIGFLGEILPNLNLGASYQSKMWMGRLDKYSGLFAENGDFDIPSNWTIGLAFKATPELIFLFDVQEIYYSDVRSVHNSFLPNIMTSSLGNNSGAGFGWDDMTIYKLGVQWQSSKDWTWRAGYSFGEQPIPDSEVLFNMLAPGVIEQHATFGFTKTMGSNQDLSFALTRAFSKSITGENPLEVPGQQTIKLRMDQWEIALGYTWKF